MERLLASLELPAGLAELRESYGTPLPPADLMRAMGLDKKGRAGRPRFVLAAAVGEPLLDVEVPEQALAALLA